MRFFNSQKIYTHLNEVRKQFLGIHQIAMQKRKLTISFRGWELIFELGKKRKCKITRVGLISVRLKSLPIRERKFSFKTQTKSYFYDFKKLVLPQRLFLKKIKGAVTLELKMTNHKIAILKNQRWPTFFFGHLWYIFY